MPLDGARTIKPPCGLPVPLDDVSVCHRMDELQNGCTRLNKVLKTLAQQPNEPTDHLLDYSEKPCRMQDAGISQVVENNRTTCHSKIFPISYLSTFRPDPEGGGLVQGQHNTAYHGQTGLASEAGLMLRLTYSTDRWEQEWRIHRGVDFQN
ncbi:hypothetical protein P5673_022991 [Acropora cervicornis]|uniref:Uncharacterized protein n=1 Tax=Acropora cervicornis TaxID=6130 RepID=A0AAD9Q667_ACRCE|nr:hypothetical protein P5673_022991 [Acropora cervicornis]